MKKILMVFSLALALISCGKSGEGDKKKKEGEQVAVQKEKVPAIDIANMDQKINPCDNFYLYANGGWIKNNPVPASESRWSCFNELYDNNQNTLKTLITQTTQSEHNKGSVEQLVADFYTAGMDSAHIEQQGIKPIKADLQKIDAISDITSLQAEMIRHKKTGISGNFSFYVYIDDKNTDANIPFFNQGGLGMPDRDYYLQSDEDKTKIKKAYMAYMTKAFEIIGSEDATKNAQSVLDLETALAKASKSKVDLRDPVANYNKMSVKELESLLSNLDVPSLVEGLGIASAENVVVGQPDFFKTYNTLLKTIPLDTWKAYLQWSVVRSAAPYLYHPLVQANFDFYQKALRGTKEMKPRWKRVISTTDHALGEPLGQLYVKTAFTPASKKKMMTLIDNLVVAYKKHIGALEWMSDATKKEAYTKLASFRRKIGYPDKWKDYSKINITKASYWDNIKATNTFDYDYMVSKLGKPVDKDEWLMTPPTVNAYYNPTVNEIVFPAGILQPPFFNPFADDAVNYGAIGAVIGHELSHGFDDSGRQYDATGTLRDWWLPEDATKFKKKADQVVALYGAQETLPGVKVNGNLTLGENIADLGGLSIAFTAYKNSLNGKKVADIDGLSDDLRFFIAWAQVWRTNATDEFLKNQVQTDPHSPAVFRTNLPVSNMEAFQKACGCKEGDKLFVPKDQRVKVW